MQDRQATLHSNTSRVWKNWLFTKVVTLSGWLVLLTLGLLIFHLVRQVMPMFGDVTMHLKGQWTLPANHKVLQLQDIAQGRFVVTQDSQCALHFNTIDTPSGRLHTQKVFPGLCNEKIKVVSSGDQSYLARLSSSGILRVEQIQATPSSIEHPPVSSFALTDAQEVAAIEEWQVVISERALMAYVKLGQVRRVFWVDRANPSHIVSDTINQAQDLILLPKINQFAYLHNQHLFNRDITTLQTHYHELLIDADTLLAFENQRSLMLLSDLGDAQKWSLENRKGQLGFVPLYSLKLDARVVAMQSHRSENAALLVDDNFQLTLINHVTGQVIEQYPRHLGGKHFNWINNSLYGTDGQRVFWWQLSNLSAVNTFSALWDPVRYQGYSEPAFVWQTTYAKDYQEPKYSVVPLVVGSIKASFLALIIAVPLALMAATYTAYFAPRKIRDWMKPSIEMLESIPSVVLGFIAAIWLAPLTEQFLLSIILFVVLIPVTLMVFAFLYPAIVRKLPWHIHEGWELFIVATLLILNGYLVMSFGHEIAASQDSSMAWLNDINKSSLVLAVAMGVAITPSIYSIAEDAIFEVPASYKQASFALGANRLQTLRKVVLTLAYPGILSAVMLGLGRALGETMIVLMVTGNTPVADWDLLSGIRTLTANLAIELPEADASSSHYQILFLTALLLFSFTFVINTLAEALRQWLRRNYQHA